MVNLGVLSALLTPSGSDRKNSQPEMRQLEPEKKPAPKQIEAPSRESQTQPEPSPRAKNQNIKVQDQALPNAGERTPPEKRAKESAVPVPKNPEAQSEGRKAVVPAPESKPTPRQIQPPARQPRLDGNEKGAQRLLPNNRQQNQPAQRSSPPAAQPGRENPGPSDRSQPTAPDKDREKRDRQ